MVAERSRSVCLFYVPWRFESHFTLYNCDLLILNNVMCMMIVPGWVCGWAAGWVWVVGLVGGCLGFCGWIGVKVVLRTSACSQKRQRSKNIIN